MRKIATGILVAILLLVDLLAELLEMSIEAIAPPDK